MVRQPEWLNGALRALWPHVGSAVSRQAAAGGRLEQELNTTAVWRPRFLTGAYVHVRWRGELLCMRFGVLARPGARGSPAHQPAPALDPCRSCKACTWARRRRG